MVAVPQPSRAGLAAGAWNNHELGKCRCLLSAECLNAVRRSRMVPLDAVAKLSGLSREYLAKVERGEKDQCVDTRVVLAYENAIGTPIEEEMLAVMFAYVQAHGSLPGQPHKDVLLPQEGCTCGANK